jgi:hypothetical protein
VRRQDRRHRGGTTIYHHTLRTTIQKSITVPLFVPKISIWYHSPTGGVTCFILSDVQHFELRTSEVDWVPDDFEILRKQAEKVKGLLLHCLKDTLLNFRTFLDNLL